MKSWCLHYRASFLIFLFAWVSSYGQKIDTTQKGMIYGSVKDTSLNYFMQAATVSVYKTDNGSLLSYTLTNSLGEFTIRHLPSHISLTVTISFIGYQSYSKIFTVTGETLELNLGEIDLKKDEKVLENVVVKPPPVRMHGDTLEFSAAAFELDKNAVAEDLLKKLPGIIVWGDGTITVNGRQISKLLVDGKPFFGGDTRVATQNIPKSSIDKVQVYQEFIDPNNPLDSITSINFKLKKSQHSGYFGLLSAGKGSQNKYECSINNNLFSPRNQFAIAGQTNNVNKLGNDFSTLLKNNTFKGTGAKVEYQPDFTLQGTNVQLSGGLLFSHDFIPEFNQYSQNRIIANGFYNDLSNTIISDLTTTSSLGGDSILQQHSYSNINSDINEFHILSRYTKRKIMDSLMIEGDYTNQHVEKNNNILNDAYSPQIGTLSTSRQIDNSTSSIERASLNMAFDHHGFTSSASRKVSNWSVSYKITATDNNVDRKLNTNFFSETDSTFNKYFNRKYDNSLKGLQQSISVKIGDFSPWLFGGDRVLSKFGIRFDNDADLKIEKLNNKIADGDSLSSSYSKNSYLSTLSQYRLLNYISGFHLDRNFLNILANRYQKELDFFVEAKMQLYNENLTSIHAFQEFTNTSLKFTPSAGIGYSNFQYGEFINRYNLSVGIQQGLPTPDQRVVLIDSSEIYNLHIGNPSLQPFKQYQASFRYRHDVYGVKNTLNYGGSVNIGFKKNYFGDSITIDNQGRYIYYNVNLNGNRYAQGNIFFNKAFLQGDHQFQVSLGASAQTSRNPGYLAYQSQKSQYFISSLFINADSLTLNYVFKDLIAVNILQSYFLYQNNQHSPVNSRFVNTQVQTRIGIGLNLTKKMMINSNITFNSNKYSRAASTEFSIWNASFGYRLLKGNNLEIKFSALDLLNQNKGITNYGNSYSFTHGISNLQHQYFMISASYFPRKFGLNKKSQK